MTQIIIFMGKNFQWHCERLLMGIHFSIFLMFLLFHLYTDTSDIPESLHWDPEDDQKESS